MSVDGYIKFSRFLCSRFTILHDIREAIYFLATVSFNWEVLLFFIRIIFFKERQHNEAEMGGGKEWEKEHHAPSNFNLSRSDLGSFEYWFCIDSG